MVDYYPALLRAVSAPEAGDAQWRRAVYDRARQVVAKELRSRRPPAPLAEVAAEQAALEAAIQKIEAQILGAADDAIARRGQTDDLGGDISAPPWSEPRREPISTPSRRLGSALFVLPVAVAALAAAAYTYWAMTADKTAPRTVKSEAASPSAAPPASRATNIATAKDGDLAPGIDGGSTDVDLPYVFRRQPTFYRTTMPVGTVIIDKLQHFLYLIEPNNVALRYGIGLGDQCIDLAGLRRISSKAEWPPWQPPPDMVKRKLANAGTMPGGPGNPLGARVLELDDGSSRINGTNAPKTIGNLVAFGCIRLVNDDIVDLYNRVQLATPVVVQ
jgi:lipoprotein-anchoring transpeptidase ErfK/SrfK